MSRPVQRPAEITQWDQVLNMLDARNDKTIIPFGGGSPDVSQPSLKPLWRELSRVIQHNIIDVLSYDELAGRRELREQIARLMLDGGSVVTADELVITSGCHSALSLALLAVCQPGDIVAVESPCYYGTMQMLRGLGLKAIEIPTDPNSGISVEAPSWRWSSGRSKGSFWCRTATIRWDLSCRTPANAPCCASPSATIS